jgi:DNA-binding MarR family transcriptional regulator
LNNQTQYTFIVKSLDNETINATLIDCSSQLMDVAPVIMRNIRHEMRLHTMSGQNIPQFRALHYLERHPRASLSELAEFLGLTPPSTSKLVQKFVSQKIITRRAASDRRRVCLSLTPEGVQALAQARQKTREKLIETLRSLTPQELATISQALKILSIAFAKGETGVDLSKTV